MDVLISEMGGIFSQCMCMSIHHDIHLKYLKFYLNSMCLNKTEIR